MEIVILYSKYLILNNVTQRHQLFNFNDDDDFVLKTGKVFPETLTKFKIYFGK